uniref:Uncharacterized protein n=1 Tax=Anguilla anguilla TaxID=7936 RepID=A0A0E9WI33_ANGAN
MLQYFISFYAVFYVCFFHCCLKLVDLPGFMLLFVLNHTR